MTQIMLLRAEETPCRIGIEQWTEHGKIVAVSGCCGRFIHFNHDTNSSWFCAECKEAVKTYEELYTVNSSQIHLAGMDEETVAEWVSYWTGYPVGRVSVSIRS